MVALIELRRGGGIGARPRDGDRSDGGRAAQDIDHRIGVESGDTASGIGTGGAVGTQAVDQPGHERVTGADRVHDVDARGRRPMHVDAVHGDRLGAARE